MVGDTLRTAIAAGREDGFRSTFSRGTSRATNRLLFNRVLCRLSPRLALGVWDAWRSVCRRRQGLRHRRSPDRYTDADPLKTITVDPSRIEYRFDRPAESPIERDRYAGLLYDGAWDTHRIAIRDRIFFQSLEAVYRAGHAWEETEWYRAAASTIESGGQMWDCRTRADLASKCEHVDRLYEALQTEGYVSQRDLVARGDGSFPLLDPVVSIGRDGELLHFRDGNHRLALSKLLGLETITVRIGIRHTQWQRVRDEIAATDDLSELDPAHESQRSHPDLEDLLD